MCVYALRKKTKKMGNLGSEQKHHCLVCNGVWGFSHERPSLALLPRPLDAALRSAASACPSPTLAPARAQGDGILVLAVAAAAAHDREGREPHRLHHAAVSREHAAGRVAHPAARVPALGFLHADPAEGGPVAHAAEAREPGRGARGGVHPAPAAGSR